MKARSKLVQLKNKCMKMLTISKVRLSVYILFFCMAIILIIVFIANQNATIRQNSKAQQSQTINTDNIAPFSQAVISGQTSAIDLYVDPKNAGPLYTTEEKGIGAVYEFMRENPTISTIQDQTVNVQGAQTLQGSGTHTVLPANFDKNSRLIRRISERALPKRLARDVDHYYYNQTAGGVPVFGAVARFDVKADNQIIGVEGDLLTNMTVQGGTLTKESAIKIALQKATLQNLHGSLTPCSDRPVEKIIINKKLLGLSLDETNQLTWSVSVCNTSDPITFDTTYYVSMQSGTVVFQNEHVTTARSRVVYNCGSGACQQSRTEGQAPSGDSEVDNSYDIVGDMYDYIFNTYQRDSFDNRGSTINAKTRYTAFQCPNAAWNGREMAACPGMVARDVWGHELFHGITQYTSGLMYQYQSGTLNESFSDIFGYALDSGNWTMGETTSIGVIRRFDDPTKSRTPQPDRLFASQYYCGASDSGGVHVNSGILNKAFYLMTAGGSFNGCTIAALGKEKTLPIMFKADTVYLQPSANIKDAYDSIMKSCGDLYGLSSSDCQTVKAALQATEMDQQPAGTQSSPKCSGGQAQTPACVGGQVQPTTAPTSTPTSVLSPIPTTQPTNMPQPTVEIPTDTPPVDQLTTTPVPTNVDGITLSMKLRLQGVVRAPTRTSTIPVRITLVKNDYSYEDVKTVNFSVNSNGIWSGTATFDAPAGSNYYVLVKGPMHIQKRIGHITPSEPQPGTYRSGRSTLNLVAGNNDLDFSGIVLLVGDLPDQDGVVNSYDISLVRNNLGKTDIQTVALCDVNYDGVCSTQDHSLLIVALAVKVDDE